MDHFNMNLSETDVRRMSSLALAHVGDAVFELMVRTRVAVLNGGGRANDLHKATVKLVSAPAQAEAVHKILPMLTEEEQDVYRRGRNTKVNSVPRAASMAQYHDATGLEALFGYLYLKGLNERLNELFNAMLEG